MRIVRLLVLFAIAAGAGLLIQGEAAALHDRPSAASPDKGERCDKDRVCDYYCDTGRLPKKCGNFDASVCDCPEPCSAPNRLRTE